MPYVDRDPSGRIVGIYAVQQHDGQEFTEGDVQLSPSVPQVVSRFQALAALQGAGLLSQAQALFADPQASALARLAWENATEFVRTSPTVLQLAPALGLDDTALDTLFAQAAQIEA